MRIASVVAIVCTPFTIAGCASAAGDWGAALERGAAYSAAEALAVEAAQVPLAAPVAMAHYDAAVGLWQCRLTDGSLHYSRTECVPQTAGR